jgi:hypothetical protein
MLRVSTSDFARGERIRATVPRVGASVRGLVVGADAEGPQGPKAAGRSSGRAAAGVVRDGLPVQRFGVGDGT